MQFFKWLITFQWLFPKKKESQLEMVERSIAIESAALESTERALETAGDHVRRKATTLRLIEDDIQILKTRVQEAMKTGGRDAARPIMTDLLAKETEWKEANEALQIARTSHAKLEAEKEEHRKEIKSAKELLEDLKVRGTTADARNRTANRESLKDVAAGLKTEVRTKETSADLEAELRRNPDSEYLDAGVSGSIEERLAQLEKETQ